MKYQTIDGSNQDNVVGAIIDMENHYDALVRQHDGLYEQMRKLEEKLSIAKKDLTPVQRHTLNGAHIMQGKVDLRDR